MIEQSMKNESQKGKSIPTKKLWLAISILALLSPLGLLLPTLLGAKGAWGEWGLDQIEKMAGFVPEGMKRLAGKWNAPMTNYAVPGQGEGLLHGGLGYFLTAIIGIVATAGLVYLLARLLTRRDGSPEDR